MPHTITLHPVHGAIAYLRSLSIQVEEADGAPGLYNVGGLRDLTVNQVISIANDYSSALRDRDGAA